MLYQGSYLRVHAWADAVPVAAPQVGAGARMKLVVNQVSAAPAHLE